MSARRIRPGNALFVTHALLSYLVVSCLAYLPGGERQDEITGYLVLLWLAISLWGLAHAAYVLYRAAFPARCPHCQTILEAA